MELIFCLGFNCSICLTDFSMACYFSRLYVTFELVMAFLSCLVSFLIGLECFKRERDWVLSFL